MTTVVQAMHTFMTSLELSDSKREDAQRQWAVLDGNLKGGLSVRQSFLSGSYGRRTAITPLNDIDLFVVLEPLRYPDLGTQSPTVALGLVKDVLDNKYPTAKPAVIQGRSVNIAFSTSGIAYDVVPALPDTYDTDKYRIPDRDTNRWIYTNPRIHADLSTKANQTAGDMAKPLVKVVKHWKYQPDNPDFRSFHLEWMVYDALKSKPDSYLAGLVTIFHHMKTRVLTEFPDPAVLGSPIDNNLDWARRSSLSHSFATVAQTLTNALDASNAGRTEEAHYLLRQVFGNQYPEKGAPPKAGAGTVGGVAAVDNPRNRFG